ncbi:unnamed protein product [Spodoptera littoralis]|uniref:Protein FAM98A n=1 Tax=Spodoptera littoralis TaxID=7109 RepID=A0A9P0N2P9_SPOLI|nr:unnamed protein product [Spodoptera littoralis]CAH1642481.1 unnamed protein product [Spodoptera littoralis]
MENDILDSLNDLGYEGPLTDEATFAKALDGGPKSLDFTKLVHILAEEIKSLCNLEETVNMMNDPDESSSFLLELSSFLKELKCPYKKLVTGHMSSRLQTKEDRLLLLDYLISELMAARMVNVDGPKDKQAAGMEIVVQESPTARDLKNILIALKFNKPPPNITAEMLFAKLEAKLKETIQKEGNQLVGKPLYNKALSEKEWKQLESAFNEMFEEYRLRRETLITRLECTIQSFEWSDRLKTKRDVIQSTYRPKRESLKVKPDVKLADFLAARTSLLQVEKTSNASVRKNTQTDVNKVIIGQIEGAGPMNNNPLPQKCLRGRREMLAAVAAAAEVVGGVATSTPIPASTTPIPTLTTPAQVEEEGDRGDMEDAGDEGGAGDGCRADIARGAETMAGPNKTETTRRTRFPRVVTATRTSTARHTHTSQTRTTTNITRATVVIAKVVTTVWAPIIRGIKVAAAAAAVATKNRTKIINKATNITRAISPTRAIISLEVAIRMNTTIETDVAEEATGAADVDLHQ